MNFKSFVQHLLIQILVVAITSCSCNNRPNAAKSIFGVSNADSITKIEGVLNISGNPVSIEVPCYDRYGYVLGRIDDVFDSISILPLETDANCIVGEVSSLDILKDTLYFLDTKTKTPFVFDINGKFVRKIGYIGNGPGEYSDPSSMHVDDDYVYLFDMSLKKLIKYNHQGDFVSDHSIPFFCRDLMPLKNGDFLCDVQGLHNDHLPEIEGYRFAVCDSSFELISKVGITSGDCKQPFLDRRLMQSCDSVKYCFDWLSNTVFEVLVNGNLRKCAFFDFRFNGNDILNFSAAERLSLINSGELNILHTYTILENCIAYSVAGNDWPVCYIFHNIIENKSKYFTIALPPASNISRIIGMDTPLTSFNGSIVYSLTSEDVLSSYELYSSQTSDLWAGAPESCREFDKKLLESLHDEDNPILVFAKIKDHFD